MEKNTLYKVYDNYDEDMEIIARCDNLNEVKKACDKRIEETDEECFLIVTKRNDILKRYEIVEKLF